MEVQVSFHLGRPRAAVLGALDGGGARQLRSVVGGLLEEAPCMRLDLQQAEVDDDAMAMIVTAVEDAAAAGKVLRVVAMPRRPAVVQQLAS